MQVSAAIQDVVDTLGAELETLSKKSHAKGAASSARSLHAHLALLTKLTAQPQDVVVTHCLGAGGHPLAVALLAAISEGLKDAEAFGSVAAQRYEQFDQQDSATKALCKAALAETWLYRFASPEKAIELAAQAFDEVGATTKQELQNTYQVSLAVTGDWEQLQSLHSVSNEVGHLLAAAQIAHDRMGAQTQALEILRKLDFNNTSALYQSSLEYEILHANTEEPLQEHWIAYWGQRLSILETHAAKSPEYQCSRFSLAHYQEQAGLTEQCLQNLRTLPDDSSWSNVLKELSVLRITLKHAKAEDVAKQLAVLASISDSGLAEVYWRRRAEILDHRMDDKEKAKEAWLALFESCPTESGLALQRLSMDNPVQLVEVLKSIADASASHRLIFLRRAAAVAETRANNPELAIELLRLCAEESSSIEDLHCLAAVYLRQGKPAEVARLYSDIASKESDPSTASPLLLAAAILNLAAGQVDETLRLLNVAGERLERNSKKKRPRHELSTCKLAVAVLLANVHRNMGALELLRKELSVMSKLLQNSSTQFSVLCELGKLCVTLGDVDSAKSALSKATALRPDDSELLLVQADLADGASDWAQSIALRRQAVDAMQPGSQASAVHANIGRIEAKELNNWDAAEKAFGLAHEMEPGNLEYLRNLQEVYYKQKKYKKLLQLQRAECELLRGTGEQLSLLLAIAETSEMAKEPGSKSLDSYQQVLAIDPDHAAALSGLQKIAASEKKFDVIVSAYSKAKESEAHLKVLSDAYREQENWPEFVAVMRRRLGLHSQKSSPVAKQIALEIAKISEVKLHDKIAAAAGYQVFLELDSSSFDTSYREAQRELRRLLTDTKDWAGFVRATEAELKTIEETSSTVAGRVSLLSRNAEVLRDELAQKSKAAESYEMALALESNKSILTALEELYAELGANEALLRVMESRVKDSNSPLSCESLRQIAELRMKTGDVTGAIDAYQKAISINPADREIFTALEKLCYSEERWDDVLVLYNEVIIPVESGECRAYRLGDLYSRRGQVQMQYMAEPRMAIASFLRVVEVSPEDNKAMEYLHELFAAEKNWTDLIAAYQVRANSTKNKEVIVESLRKAAAIAEVELQDPKESNRLLLALMNHVPDDDVASEKLEAFYNEQGDWTALIKVLEVRLAKQEKAGRPETSLIQQLAKLSEEGLRDEKRAVRYHQRLIEIAPQSRRSLDALARIYESTEQWTEFIEVTRRLVKVTKDRSVKALLYFKCGSVTEAKFNNEEDAIRYYDAAIKTSASCLPAVHGLRDVYLRRKDWARVIQTLELEVKLWQDDKERAGVYAQIGRIYGEEINDNERALRFYESALAVDSECLPANRALFEHFFTMQQWSRAEPVAQALTPKAKQDSDPERRSEFYYKRGVVLQHTGKPGLAVDSIVSALEIDPQNLAAVASLTDVASAFPNIYDFRQTYDKLEKMYRRQGTAGKSQELLAQVMVGQAEIVTRGGNLQAANEMLQEAIERNPDNVSIGLALVDLHISVRNWASALSVLKSYQREGIAVELQLKVMMKQFEMYSVCQMKANLAAQTVKKMLLLDPENPELYYLLAQELYCLKHFAEAQQAIEKVIELAAGPGAHFTPQQLARYTYYLGRIFEQEGEERKASAQYRRAAEYDPGYAPPALALAERSVASGNQRQAETRLINSAHAAMGQGDSLSAIQLQRGLARMLFKSGNRDAAVDAYRGILEVSPDGAADRLALAEIYAETDLNEAEAEVLKLLESSLRHGPAYRVLAKYYMQANLPIRAARVLLTMSLLGYSEEEDRVMAESAQVQARVLPIQQPITDELRMSLIATDAMNSVVAKFYMLATQQMSAMLPRKTVGEKWRALPDINDEKLHRAVAHVSRLFAMQPEIYVAENVPGRIIAIEFPRRMLFLDRSIVSESESSLRFALGWAYDAICAGYTSLLSLGEKQRSDLAQQLRVLFRPEQSQMGTTAEFIQSLPESARNILHQYEGMMQDFDMEDWIDGMNAAARRAGLVACDDLGASARMLAAINGESIGDHSSALGTVFCGEDLFKYHISDRYHQLRSRLSRMPTRSDLML